MGSAPVILPTGKIKRKRITCVGAHPSVLHGGAMPGNLSADDLPLQRIYKWERERPETVFLTQPYGGGKVRDWTWGQAVAEVRRIAAWLKTQDWEPGSRVAILSRNCAWWIMADLAIWMAGYVTVPIYPSLKAQSIRQILEHCGAKASRRRTVQNCRCLSAAWKVGRRGARYQVEPPY